MAESFALLAAYGEDADDVEEDEDDQMESAAPSETIASQSQAGEEDTMVATPEGEELANKKGGLNKGVSEIRGVQNKGRPEPGDNGAKAEPNGGPKRSIEQASGWKSPPEERRSPKIGRIPGASPVGSRAGSKSPLDVGRLGRSPLGQRMGLAGGEENEEHERRSGGAEASGRGSDDEDDLSDFLPPPPEGKCSEELQKKFAKWVDLLRQGQSYNDAMRRSKPYRNPDFLGKVVAYQEIDEIGSCFAKDVFDPHGLPDEDFYDNLAAAQRQEAEQREQEKRKLGKVDFVKGGVQAPALAASTGSGGRPAQLASKVITPPLAKVPSIPPAAMAAAKVTDIRPGKRTKWDKVEDRSGLPPLDAVAVARERAAAISGGGSGRATSVSRK